MELIINDQPQHGVLIHGPASPGFKDRLIALIEIPTDFDDDILQYSIIIENKSSQHIVNWKIVWRFYPSNDAPFRYLLNGAPFTVSQGEGLAGDPVFNNELGGVINPSGHCPYNLVLRNLYLVLGKHRFGVQWSTGTRPSDEPKKRLDQIKAMLAASVRWSVDIDGVLFDDGVFIGPDTAHQDEFHTLHNEIQCGLTVVPNA
jgi:hypothetical protein